MVDDVPDVLDLLEIVLSNAGAKVNRFASASQALEFLQTNTPHLLLSDISMPGMTGYDLIRFIRQKKLYFPAIALSALTDVSIREKSLDSGFDEYLAKPVNKEYLVSRIKQMVRTV